MKKFVFLILPALASCGKFEVAAKKSAEASRYSEDNCVSLRCAKLEQKRECFVSGDSAQLTCDRAVDVKTSHVTVNIFSSFGNSVSKDASGEPALWKHVVSLVFVPNAVFEANAFSHVRSSATMLGPWVAANSVTYLVSNKDGRIDGHVPPGDYRVFLVTSDLRKTANELSGRSLEDVSLRPQSGGGASMKSVRLLGGDVLTLEAEYVDASLGAGPGDTLAFKICPSSQSFVCGQVMQGASMSESGQTTPTVCGCEPSCPPGEGLIIGHGRGTWPDGSARASYACSSTPPP